MVDRTTLAPYTTIVPPPFLKIATCRYELNDPSFCQLWNFSATELGLRDSNYHNRVSSHVTVAIARSKIRALAIIKLIIVAS